MIDRVSWAGFAPFPETPDHYSASQIETWRAPSNGHPDATGCERKWAFDKIDKLPRKDSRSAALGTRVHCQLETRFSASAPAPSALDHEASNILHPGIAYLPPYGSERNWVSESAFDLDLGPHRFIGFLDLRLHDTYLALPEAACEIARAKDPSKSLACQDGFIPTVIDLKSTSDFKWAKTAEHLAERDVQAGLYAEHIARLSGWRYIAMRWLYVRTKGAARAMPVDFRIDTESLSHVTRIGDIRRDADNISAKRKHLKRAIDYTPNLDACSAYGGCPYQAHCPRDPLSQFAAAMRQESSLQAMAQPLPFPLMPFAAPSHGGAPAPPAPPAFTPMPMMAPPAPPAPPAQPAASAEVDVRQYLVSDEYGRVISAPNGYRLPNGVIESQSVFVPNRGIVSFARPALIGTEVAEALSAVAMAAAQAAAVNPPEAQAAQAPAAVNPPEAQAAQAPVAKRGRPPGSKNKASEGSDAVGYHASALLDAIIDRVRDALSSNVAPS